MTRRRKHHGDQITSRTTLVLRSTGDAAIGLAVDERQPDRMAPLLTLIDTERRSVLVELTAADVKNLHHDAEKLLSASAEQVSAWWTELTGWTQDDADAGAGTDHCRRRCRRASARL